jgi:hypothetical protein
METFSFSLIKFFTDTTFLFLIVGVCAVFVFYNTRCGFPRVFVILAATLGTGFYIHHSQETAWQQSEKLPYAPEDFRSGGSNQVFAPINKYSSFNIVIEKRTFILHDPNQKLKCILGKLKKAYRSYRKGRLDEAKCVLDELSREKSENASVGGYVHLLLADILRLKNQYRQSIPLYEKAREYFERQNDKERNKNIYGKIQTHVGLGKLYQKI